LHRRRHALRLAKVSSYAKVTPARLAAAAIKRCHDHSPKSHRDRHAEDFSYRSLCCVSCCCNDPSRGCFDTRTPSNERVRGNKQTTAEQQRQCSTRWYWCAIRLVIVYQRRDGLPLALLLLFEGKLLGPWYLRLVGSRSRGQSSSAETKRPTRACQLVTIVKSGVVSWFIGRGNAIVLRR
jgi:hypothetical protein